MKKSLLFLLFILFSITSQGQLSLEGFENTTGPDALPSTNWTLATGNWTVFDNGVGSNQRWKINSTVATPVIVYQGTNAAYIQRENLTTPGLISEDYLATPLVTIPTNGELHFFTRTSFAGNLGTTYKVMVAPSTASQTTPASYTTVQQWTDADLVVSNTAYEEKIVSLSAYAGQQVYVALVRSYTQVGTGLSGNNWLVDNVSIVQQCTVPTTLTSTAVLYNGASLSWANPSGATSWEIEVIPATGTPTGTGTIYNGTLPYPATGLLPNTAYKFYVRALCGAGNNSAWSTASSTFTTQVAPPQCGGNYVDSGGTTGNYASNEDITTTICPTNTGDLVTVTFTSFNTETNYDGLYVYDGNSITSPQISSTNGAGTSTALSAPGAFWGTTNPGPFTASSSNGCLTFRFKSDGSVVRAGWVANITCAPAPTCPKPTALSNNTVTSNSATIAWTNVGTATNWQILKLPCGSPAPSGTVTGAIDVTSNPYTLTGLSSATCYDVYVRAICSTTDSSTWTGPTTFTTQVAPPQCGGNFVDNGGISANYANSSDVTTTICPTNPGDQVTVTFTSFNTETNWDALYVFDGNSITSPQIASTNAAANVPGGLAGGYWGTTIPGPFTSSSVNGCLTFRFRSDASINNPGWVANVTCAPPPTCRKPSAVASSNLTINSATISWTQPTNPDNSVANNWQVLALPCGSPAPTDSSTGFVNAPSNPFTLNSLISNTCYNVYVRAICSSSDRSSWSLATTFTTLSPPPPPCSSNLPAGDTCALATPICNLNGYCGNTSAAYTPTTSAQWPELISTFCVGSDDNDSFLTFVASSSTVNLNVWVTSSQNGDGIQMMVFSAATCGSGPVTSYFCNSGFITTGNVPFNLTATGLTPGNTYYLVIDGVAGDVCNYTIGVPSNGGISTQVTSTASSLTTCTNQPVTYTASGGNGSYVWSVSPNVNGLSSTTGNSVTFTPPSAGNYVITVSSTDNNPTCPQAVSDTKSLTVNSVTTPTFNTYGPYCNGDTVPALPTTSLNGVVGVWSPSVINNSQNGSTTYTFTPTDSCNPVYTTQIVINPIQTPSFDVFGPYCNGDTITTLPLISNNNINGTWNPSVIDNTQSLTYTFTPAIGQCAISIDKNIVVNQKVSPTFIDPAPICINTPAPSLPSASLNNIQGTWSPSTVSNTASATYTFTPNNGQCATTGSINITVNQNCSFGSYANAVWLKNCATSNFFNTVGSGTSIIGPSQNVFPNTDFGTYLVNSNTFTLKGAEVKTFKTNSANVCGATLYYRIYPQSGTPGAFSSIPLNFFSNCSGGSFQVGGGPCNPNDQKWQNVIPDNATNPSPIDLTAFPPGAYNLEVYYEITGSSTTTTQCNDIVYVNNNGANFISKYTLQATPTFTFTNPSVCNATDATITISNLAPTTSYSLTYNFNGIPLSSPVSINSNDNGQYIIQNLGVGVYSNFNFTVNGCSISTNDIITIVNPVLNPTFSFGTSLSICPGASVPSLPLISDNNLSGIWSPATVDNINGGTYTFTSNPNQCALNTSFVVTINPSTVATFDFGTTLSICTGGTVPVLQTTSNNNFSGTWSPDTVSNSANGVYTFTPTPGTCGLSTTFTVTINSNTLPTFNFGTSLTICSGGTVPTLPLISNNNVTGIWSPAIVDNQNSATYNFTSDPNQCAINTSFTVTVNSLPIVTASNVSGCSGTVINLVGSPTGGTYSTGTSTYTGSTDSTYTYTYTDGNNCTATSASATITVFALPTVTASNVNGCSGTVINLVGSPAGGTYSTGSSTYSGSTDSTYTYTYTDGNNCTATSASASITVFALPTVTASNVSGCAGTVINLVGSPAGGTYSTGSSTYSGTTSSSYTYTYVDGNNCSATSNVATITVNPIPTVTASDVSGCSGSIINLVGSPSGGTFSTGSSTYSGTTNSSYTYTYIDANNCSATSALATITVFNGFDFSLSGECVENSFIASVTPVNQSFDINTASYSWQLNNIQVSTSSTFNVSDYISGLPATSPVTYPLNFSVTVTTQNLCVLTHSISFARIFCGIQKGISVNDDGKNDYFDLTLLNVKHLSIFNRYGIKVYSKDSYTNEWKGQSDNGDELPDGTYYYVIDFNDNQASKTGWIYLAREN